MSSDDVLANHQPTLGARLTNVMFPMQQQHVQGLFSLGYRNAIFGGYNYFVLTRSYLLTIYNVSNRIIKAIRYSEQYFIVNVTVQKVRRNTHKITNDAVKWERFFTKPATLSVHVTKPSSPPVYSFAPSQQPFSLYLLHADCRHG